MKTTRSLKWTVLALALATGWSATAQRNRMSGSASTAPGPNDYNQFAQFITTRNIFDPNRREIRGSTPQLPVTQRRNPPAFTLVGTMSYEKGMFAFFDGNQSNVRKVLYQSDSNNIVGFTLAEITLAGVKLQAADKKEIVDLKIGEGMQQVGNYWQKSTQTGSSSSSRRSFGGFGGSDRGNRGFDNSSSGESAAPVDESSTPEPSAAPSSALEGNDVLKKLMERRAQEDKGN